MGFLWQLKPYHSLAKVQGDIAMCTLYQYLSHHLQELEDALVQHKIARVNVMGTAKSLLTQNAKDLKKLSIDQVHWMQGLRHINEQGLDKVFVELMDACTELREASTVNSQFELIDECR